MKENKVGNGLDSNSTRPRDTRDSSWRNVLGVCIPNKIYYENALRNFYNKDRRVERDPRKVNRPAKIDADESCFT